MILLFLPFTLVHGSFINNETSDIHVSTTDDYSDTKKFFLEVAVKVTLTMFYVWYSQAVIVYGILLYSGENYMRGIQIDFNERTIAGFQACIESKLYKEWTTFSNFLAMFW